MGYVHWPMPRRNENALPARSYVRKRDSWYKARRKEKAPKPKKTGRRTPPTPPPPDPDAI